MNPIIDNFDFKEFQPYIFLVIGLACLLISIFKTTDTPGLKTTGEKTEGIIFELAENPGSTNTDSFLKEKVTIRFVTKNKEWITADIKQEFSIFYTGQYKPGAKVDVYYDPQNPSRFFVDTKQSEKISRLLFAAVGMLFCMVALYELNVND